LEVVRPLSSVPTWWVLSGLLVLASPAAAQVQPSARQRQDRRASLPATAAEPMLELYVAANNVTTAAFNGALDRDSLVVDRTRFKWAEVSERLLILEPIEDLGPGERLLVRVGFKDRAQPSQAIIAIVSKPGVMDGKVEVDRRGNTPEALLSALAQKDAELEELKAQCAGSGPAGLVFSQWLDKNSHGLLLTAEVPPAGASGWEFGEGFAFNGTSSALVALQLRNLPGQKPWKLGQARFTSPGGTPVTVLSAQMKPSQLAPGETGLVVLEVKTTFKSKMPHTVELVDPNGQRLLLLNLMLE
jgi:uncharacterized protein (TIGR02268 family)